MRRRFLAGIALAAALAHTACAPLLAPLAHGSRRSLPLQFELPPIGRWDQVLSLEPALMVTVLTSNGDSHTGRFLAADRDTVRLVVHGFEVMVARDDVMRLDLAQRLPVGERTAKRIATGAVGGSLATVLPLQLVCLAFGGKLCNPGARLWFGGAIAGAAGAAARDRYERRPRTIYIAPAARTRSCCPTEQ